MERRHELTRREAIKTMGVGAGVVMCGPLVRRVMGGDGMDDGQTKPNILFVFTDQQHLRMMSCAGNKNLKTPAMDYLAANGIRFEHAYCSNPVCMPSRAGMATGMMPGRLGVYKNGDPTTVPSTVRGNSMGELMSRAGYDTFYGGKVHMDKAFGPENGAYDVVCSDERSRLPVECVKFMTQRREKPFFAVASLINPHDICFAHRAREGKRSNVADLYAKADALPDDQLPPLPDNYGLTDGEPAILADNLSTKACTPPGTMRKEYSDREWRINRWIYCRLTERVDGEIKVMLDGLKAAGLEENTLVIFTSDHGNMDASHRLASKGRFYEESAGVPFLMMYKGVISAGGVDGEHLINTGLDILPTCCDYAGVQIPAHVQGRSLRALAEGRSVDDWRSHVVSENHRGRMLRSRRYKYCSYGLEEGMEELFDMKKDPGEMKNLAADAAHRDALAAHRSLLREWCDATGDAETARFVRRG